MSCLQKLKPLSPHRGLKKPMQLDAWRVMAVVETMGTRPWSLRPLEETAVNFMSQGDLAVGSACAGGSEPLKQFSWLHIKHCKVFRIQDLRVY